MADGKKLADLKLGASLNRLGISGRGRSPSGSGLTRLGSLKPARDLTLGSTPKRNFVPNIPARRTVKEEPSNDKPEATASSQQGDGKRNRGGTPRRGRDRGRGRGRGRGEIVTSQSIFSQGPFALNRPGASREATSSYSSQGNRESCHGEPRSRSSVIREGKGGLESGEDSQRILNMLSDSGKMEIDDEEIQRGGLMPITIPLANPKLLGDQLKEIKVDPRQQTVKEEDIEMSDFGLKPKMIGKFTHQVTCDQLFNSNFEKEQLLFLQFPDALPIKPLSHESDVHNESEAAEKVDTHQASDEDLQKFSFTNVSEGYIGKLVVHKSGKVRMLLGNASFDVDMGTPCGFLQDLVAIHLDNNRKEMVCLGHVNQRVLCVPDFDELVGSAAS